MKLRREAPGLYCGGPGLRFTARRLKRTLWLASDKKSGRREQVKRLRDARLMFQFVIAVEPVAAPPTKKGAQLKLYA